MEYIKIKNIDEIVDKVFNLEGFLTNYNSNPNYFYSSPSGHIGRVNPKKLLFTVYKYGYLYDKRILHQLIDNKIDINLDETIIWSDWEQKQFYTKDELKNYLLKNKTFEYVEYAYK